MPLDGRLDHQVAHRLREELTRAASGEAPRVVVDMSAVTRVDSAAVGVIVGAFVSIQRAGGRLVLANPNRIVRQVLHTTRLDSVIDIYPTAEAALSHV